jgi:peptide deformylase
VEILKHPNPILKAFNASVEESEISTIVAELIPGMIEIINTEETLGLGLAAPQIGVNKKFFIMRTGSDSAYGFDKSKISVIFNPEIKKVVGDKHIVFREGCLSVPDKMCIVARAKEIKVKYTDEFGKSQKRTFKGTDSVVFQHEFDHLFGLEMLDRAIKVIDLPEVEEEGIDETKFEIYSGQGLEGSQLVTVNTESLPTTSPVMDTNFEGFKEDELAKLKN